MPAAADAPAPGWDGHLLLLHASEEERRAGLAAWVRRGLDRDEKVVYSETAGEPADRSVLSVLRDHGIDGAAATAAGHLLGLPLAEFYPPGGPVEVVERALAEGYGAVRMTAEAIAVLTVLTAQRYAHIERAWDRLCRTHPVSALCQYDRATPAGQRLDAITATHTGGIRERLLSTAASTDGLTVAGEIDVTNEDALTWTLRAATSRASSPFRLDVSGVSFLGCDGARALAAGTRAYRARGGRLVVAGPQPLVARVLRLLQVDELAGVELVGADRGQPWHGA